MAKRKAEDRLERPKEPPTFEQVARKSKLLAAFMDTETKNVKPTAEEKELAAQIKREQDQDLFGIYFMANGSDVKFTSQQLHAAVHSFAKKIRMHRRTGKGSFSSSSSSDSKETKTLLDDITDLPISFFVLSKQPLYVKTNVGIKEGIDFIWKYYKSVIKRHLQSRLWVINQTHVAKLSELVGFDWDGEPDDHDEFDIQRDKESHPTHVLMLAILGVVTGQRRFFGRDHFWLILHDGMFTLREWIRDLINNEEGDEELWESVSLLNSFSEVARSQSGPCATFAKYLVARFIFSSSSADANVEFLMSVLADVLDPLLEESLTVLRRSSNRVWWWQMDEPMWRASDLEEDPKILPLVRFLLQPNTENRLGAELPVSFELNDADSKANRELLVNAHNEAVLAYYKAAYTDQANDRAWLTLDLLEYMAASASNMRLFAIENQKWVMPPSTIDALILYSLLAHPDWCKNEQIAIVGRRDAEDSEALFNRLMDEKYLWEDQYEAVALPPEVQVFEFNLDDLEDFKTNQHFYEWVIKKHPVYRRKLIDTFLFDTPLGQIRPWVERSSSDGHVFVGKGEKATYRVVPKKAPDRPLGDKFGLYVERKKDITENEDEEKEENRLKSKRLKLRLPVAKELPDDIYRLISEFHIKGKVIDQAWCERNDQDTDIREYLFPGYWRLLHCASFQALLAKDIAFAKRLVQFVAEVLPCDNCREHFNEQLEAAEVPLASMTGPQLQQFLVDAHNKVNKENGKPVLSLHQARTESALASDADLPGFWDLLHRRAARVKFSWDRADLIQLARLVTELTLGLYPTWYRKLVRDLEKVQDIQDMFEMTVSVHNKINKKTGTTTCHMELEQARRVYS